MKFIAVIFFLFVAHATTHAQQVWYVAAKTGLSIRERPDAAGKVLDKIPYGTRVTVTYDSLKVIAVEGFVGSWARVNYNGKSGYIVNSYLIPLPPPKATVKTMKEYFAQVTSVVGAPFVVKNGQKDIPEGEGWELKKQFYKNGAEWHQFSAYESGTSTYFLPGFTIEQAFILIRLIPEFKEAFDEKDAFPRFDREYKKGETAYTVKIENEMIGDDDWIKRIKLDFAPGAEYTFEMLYAGNQIIIIFGGGL
jgi:hypothetical protein